MRLLLVGTKKEPLSLAATLAQQHGAQVRQVMDIHAALEQLCSGQGADLLMVDAVQDITTLLCGLDAERIHVPVVAYGIDTSPQQAAAAIKAGAKEFIPLPPDSELIASILQAISEDQTDMIVHSAAMKEIVTIADRVAPSPANVLITGESGTGKEVIAHYIHKKSPRANAPFVSINCAAIPENLLESELFGHEKGAFTGASHRRVGKFEEASGGTLLLDEISEMDIRLQAKLLRAIQEKQIDRVGGTKPVPVDIRILATSNRNLPEEVKNGTFREDLLFRLNVIELALPPLRDRPEDILPFANHFIHRFSEINGVPPLSLSPEAETVLRTYHWPGNVREMENRMHRAVLLSTGSSITPEVLQLSGTAPLTTSDAPSEIHTTQAGVASLVGQPMEKVEKDLILQTLDHCLGNRTKTANVLGISIRTLRNKLNQYSESVNSA